MFTSGIFTGKIESWGSALQLLEGVSDSVGGGGGGEGGRLPVQEELPVPVSLFIFTRLNLASFKLLLRFFKFFFVILLKSKITR